MTNIWTPGGGRVATMAPGPDDLFVVTTVSGRRALMHPVGLYDLALKQAQAAAIRMAPVPVTIKVLCVTLREAQAFGFAPDDLFEGQTPQEESEWRRLMVASLYDVLRNCNEAKPRADALALLKQLGECNDR